MQEIQAQLLEQYVKILQQHQTLGIDNYYYHIYP